MAAKFTGPIPTIFSVNSPTTPESNIGYSNFFGPYQLFRIVGKKTRKLFFGFSFFSGFYGYPISTLRKPPDWSQPFFACFPLSSLRVSYAKKIAGSLRKLSVFGTNLFWYIRGLQYVVHWWRVRRRRAARFCVIQRMVFISPYYPRDSRKG